jgi:hypothetical protein
MRAIGNRETILCDIRELFGNQKVAFTTFLFVLWLSTLIYFSCKSTTIDLYRCDLRLE